MLGEFTLPEDSCNENKAFHLLPHTLSELHDDDVFELVNSGVWTPDFSTIVESNILEFIKLVIPKYLTCWANAKIDGLLNIGVGDNCEITGVPYLGELPHDKIKSCLLDTIKQNIQCEIDSSKFMEKIEIEYVELKQDLSVLSCESDRYMEKFTRDIRQYNDLLDDYNIEHAEFLKVHRQFTQKLEFMLNTTKYRDQLAEYIESHNSTKSHLIELLRGSKYIKPKQDNIHQDRDNQDRIFYWIARFRDEKSHEISLKKPDRPVYPSIYHYRQILSNMPCMRYKFIENNPELKYYLVKIKCRVASINKNVKYRDQFSNRWLYRTRIPNVDAKLNPKKQTGPGCI